MVLALVVVRMKFKDGMRVEVCSFEAGFEGAWFEGIVMSFEGGSCKVLYDKFLTDDGEPLVERLNCSQIRPRPPQTNIKNWAIGDGVDAYETDCWWRGVVSQVLPGKQYSVYFPDSKSVSTYHRSNLRSRQDWHDGKWCSVPLPLQARSPNIVRLKIPVVPNSKETPLASSPKGPNTVAHALKKRAQRIDDDFPYEKSCKVTKSRRLELAQATCQTQIEIPKNVGNSFEPHVEGILFGGSIIDIDNKNCSPSTDGSCIAFVHSSRYRKTVTRYWSAHDNNQKSNGIDIEDENKLTMHKLEANAYRSVLQAFHAQGSLNWEREALLTNLRLKLHITCEEHRLELEKLVSEHQLKM